jgi:hypothetical protein
LLQQTQPIQLTGLGRRLADGDITKDEFATFTIKTLELPNARIEDVDAWNQAGLSIQPLELILDILAGLHNAEGPEAAYITPTELVTIVIPLAGTGAPPQEYVSSIQEFRAGTLDLSGWPNCTPESNDRRMAREFLLFLDFYEVLAKSGRGSKSETFYLRQDNIESVNQLRALQRPEQGFSIESLRNDNASEIVARAVVTANVKARPQQARFRRDVLNLFGTRCLLTGETLPEVLEASHLIPVEEGGGDLAGNGVCLRADIHRLFDAGHIRIEPNGHIHLSEKLRQSPTYRNLPEQVQLPTHIDEICITWRWNYE